MEYRTSAHNDRVRRITQLAKLSCNHPSVVLTADVFPFLCHNKTQTLRPMTMETRCCKVFFPNYSKNISALRYTRTAARMGKRGEMLCFFLFFFVHAAARSGICAFTLKFVNTLIENSSRDDRPSIST